MKIVFLSTLALDANISLINALNKNHEVHFFTEALYEVFNFINKDPLKKTISKGYEVEELKKFDGFINLENTYVIKGTRNLNLLKKLAISHQIHKKIKRINPDVIIIDNYMLTYLRSTLSYREKMLLIVHDPFLHSGENFTIDQYLRKMQFRLIGNKILLNKNQKEEFITHYHEDAKKVSTSFLSVYDYITFFNNQKLHSEKKDFNVLFFGRISPYKGIKYLLDSFLELNKKKEYANINLTVAGSGDFDFDITPYQNISQIKIINNYISPSDLSHLIASSSVVVCPYTDATQSGVVMSAFAYKKPVIATNVGGLPEMIEHGKTGLIIEPKSSVAIADAIISLYNDDNLLNSMSKNIEKSYFYGEKSWDASAKLFSDALMKIKNNES